MNGPRPRLVLHVGQHKTGSKALQFFLAAHAPALRARGIFYPLPPDPAPAVRAYAVSHHRLFALLRREVMIAAGDPVGAAGFWVTLAPFYPGDESAPTWLAQIERQRLAASAHTVVLSAEDLFDFHTAHELAYAPALAARGATRLASLVADLGYAAEVVVYLRRPDHLLAAHYAQFIKGPVADDLDFPAFAAAFAPRLDAAALLAPWLAAFGADRVRVRPYEPAAQPSGIVADFFAHTLRFPVPADWPAPPTDIESVNLTPGRAHLEFIRRWKRRALPGASLLRLDEILADALASPADHRRGVAAWLSPAERRHLLARHAAGFAALAARFAPDGPPAFFAEPPPADDPAWQPDPIPSAAEFRAITRRLLARLPLRERTLRWLRRLRPTRRG